MFVHVNITFQGNFKGVVFAGEELVKCRAMRLLGIRKDIFYDIKGTY